MSRWRISLRRGLLGAFLAALGVATVVLPALAGGEAPTIAAMTYRNGIEETQYWSPSTAAVETGGAVSFENPSASVPHGLEFTGGPGRPACTGLPPGAQQKTGAVSWQASCTFAAPGTYSFICTVHPSTMKGTVTVSAAGTTTVTSTTTPTATGTPTTTTPSPYPTGGGSGSGSGSGAGGPATGQGNGGGGAASGLDALLVGGPAAVKLAAPRHAGMVHGSLVLAAAAAGATLEVDLLVPRASLAARPAAGALVGRLLRYHLAPGRQSFTIALSTRGRRALRRRSRLLVTVRIALTLPGGTAQTMTRALTLRR